MREYRQVVVTIPEVLAKMCTARVDGILSVEDIYHVLRNPECDFCGLLGGFVF